MGGGVANFFKHYAKCPAVVINWICFDAGGHEKMPQSGYIIDNYTRTYKDSNTGRNKAFKSVVQPTRVRLCPSPHFCLYRRFQKAADENLRPVIRIRHMHFTKANSTRLIRINHYYSKSKEEYLTKINVRKWPDTTERTYNENDWAFPEWKTDDSMKEAAEALRNKGVPETYSVQR